MWFLIRLFWRVPELVFFGEASMGRRWLYQASHLGRSAARRPMTEGGVGPFPDHGLDEAFGLAVGLRCVGPGADVANAEHPEHLGEQASDVAGAIVGHDALDGMPR